MCVALLFVVKFYMILRVYTNILFFSCCYELLIIKSVSMKILGPVCPKLNQFFGLQTLLMYIKKIDGVQIREAFLIQSNCTQCYMRNIMKIFINVQSFVDDADSLRRKRQKLNNSSSSILFKHIAETEKHAGNQPINFNIVKAEPAERLSPFGGPGVSNTSGLNLQPVKLSPQPHSSMQTLRPQVSPGRTPSPMDGSYNSYNPVIQQQYQPLQSNMPVTTDVPFSYQTQLPNQSQLQQSNANLLMLNKVTLNQGGLQPINNTGNSEGACLLDMDSQQFNFDWNTDFVDFGNLSANLSTGLSISDSIQPDANNAEENNMNVFLG